MKKSWRVILDKFKPIAENQFVQGILFIAVRI